MEINASNIIYGGDLDCISFSRNEAEAVYLFLLALGATNKIRFDWNEELGKIHIFKPFHYESSMIPTSVDDGKRIGLQYYTLNKYIKTLIRFDKSAYNRMKNVEKKISEMESIPKGLKTQLKN